MSDLTRAQKARLGLFLLLAVGLLAVIVVVKVGQSLFDTRDIYRVRMPGSVGALERGASVAFNGIVVGRVERVAVDPFDVAVVDIDLSLARGTPIPEDTKATVSMRGITGLKYVELTGGTNGARRRHPGEEIPAGRSLLDDLEDRVVSITAKLETVLDDAHATLNGPTMDHIEATLASWRRSSEALEWAVVASSPSVVSLIERTDAVMGEMTGMIAEGRTAAVNVSEGAKAFGAASRTFDASMLTFGETVAALGTDVKGATEQVAPLVAKISSVLERTSGDLRTALDELVQGFDGVGALTDMLRTDPSSLVFGRSAKERKLP